VVRASHLLHTKNVQTTSFSKNLRASLL
jgi:hypothetical protein